jgi:hypothetical protein
MHINMGILVLSIIVKMALQIGCTFDNFEELEKCINDYQSENFVVLMKRDAYILHHVIMVENIEMLVSKDKEILQLTK